MQRIIVLTTNKKKHIKKRIEWELFDLIMKIELWRKNDRVWREGKREQFVSSRVVNRAIFYGIETVVFFLITFDEIIFNSKFSWHIFCVVEMQNFMKKIWKNRWIFILGVIFQKGEKLNRIEVCLKDILTKKNSLKISKKHRSKVRRRRVKLNNNQKVKKSNKKKQWFHWFCFLFFFFFSQRESLAFVVASFCKW